MISFCHKWLSEVIRADRLSSSLIWLSRFCINSSLFYNQNWNWSRQSESGVNVPILLSNRLCREVPTKLSVEIIENDGLEYQIFWMLWMVVKWEYCANQCFCWSKFRISVNHVSCQSTLHNSFKYFWGNIFSLKFSQIFCFSLRFLNNKYHFKLTIVSYDYSVAWHKIVKM